MRREIVEIGKGTKRKFRKTHLHKSLEFVREEKKEASHVLRDTFFCLRVENLGEKKHLGRRIKNPARQMHKKIHSLGLEEEDIDPLLLMTPIAYFYPRKNEKEMVLVRSRGILRCL